MSKLSAFLYGFASVLGIFTMQGKPTRRPASQDAARLASYWRAVGSDIKGAMSKYSVEEVPTAVI